MSEVEDTSPRVTDTRVTPPHGGRRPTDGQVSPPARTVLGTSGRSTTGREVAEEVPGLRLLL